MLYPPELRARNAAGSGLYHAGAGRGSLSQCETTVTPAITPERSRTRGLAAQSPSVIMTPQARIATPAMAWA